MAEKFVPLVEDVIKRPRVFIQNRKEWSNEGHLQIAKSKTNNTTALQNIHTIDKRKTFYCTGVQLHLQTENVTGGTASCRIWSSKEFIHLAKLSVNLSVLYTNATMTMSFPMPIVIQGDQNIQMQSTSNSTYQVGMLFGWEEDKFLGKTNI